MSDPLKPSVALIAKLGSVVVHAQEAFSPNAHPLDVEAIRGLAADPEITEWLSALQKQGLVPVKRATQ